MVTYRVVDVAYCTSTQLQIELNKNAEEGYELMVASGNFLVMANRHEVTRGTH